MEQQITRGIDPVTSLLRAAPGGSSGMSLVGDEFRLNAAVATIHPVRLTTVLLILSLIVKFLISLKI